MRSERAEDTVVEIRYRITANDLRITRGKHSRRPLLHKTNEINESWLSTVILLSYDIEYGTPILVIHEREFRSIRKTSTQLFPHLVAGDPVPGALVEAVVSLLHKKGDPSNIGNFRPISLLTVTLKSITRVILKRVETSLDDSESLTQTGFRKGFSTLDNLHAIKQLAERTHEYGMPLYLGCVDFKNAFDCVEWNAVWHALCTFGVHPTLIDLLRRLYESSSTLIRVNEDLVPVSVKRGVRQGDTLSPRLFNAVLRSAMDDIDWETCGIRIDGRHLSHLEYADDVALVAKSRPELEMLRKLMEACARVGLEVNASKTVLLTSCSTTRAPITIDGQVFKFVEFTTYLGGRISLPLNPSEEVEYRIRLGWAAWSKLHHLLASRILPMKTKRRLFDSCILPTVLYGSEVWALRSSDKERLNVTLRKMERRMIGVTLLDRMRNERLREITQIRDWNKEALKRKAKWALKIRRMEINHWTRATTMWTPYNWKRPQGHPNTRWRDDLKRAIGPQWWNATNEEFRPILI
ncbi:hypothetical protein PFISCL1PPCAC_19986 [Pristionchus fissidentatus]|uniref:Reverse transcriptase domain-containing protein n=1 Tax=Pristionchus fissidentatus TaxID=1538716 RepID=A0AAV5WFS9_9BILA|nr:hypothetical protein PFISCL1PPCAC_19986 [Pristionchus fissidentatus]